MLRIRAVGARILASILLCTPLCFSQTQSATVSGTVLDAAGAMVPNAVVEAVSLETGATRSTISGSSGVYALTALGVGHYRITITIPGFQAYTRENVQLQVGQNLTLDAVLQLGSTSTSVDVSDTIPPLDEVSATIGGVVSGEQVRQLPINGRSWASLMTQTPGAIDSGTDNQRSIRFVGHGLDDNNYRFDGVDATGIQNKRRRAHSDCSFLQKLLPSFGQMQPFIQQKAAAHKADKWT